MAYVDETEKPKKSKTPIIIGCLAGGCLVPIIGIVIAFFVFISWIGSFMSPTPSVSKYEPSKAEIAAIEAKVEEVERVMDSGKGGTIILTESDINTFIARELKGDFPNVLVKIKDSKIQAKASIPTSEDPDTKYVNIDCTVMVTIANDQLYVEMVNGKVKDKELPQWLQESFKGTNMAEEFNQDPQNLKNIEHIESLTVKDDKLHVTIRKK